MFHLQQYSKENTSERKKRQVFKLFQLNVNEIYILYVFPSKVHGIVYLHITLVIHIMLY